MAHDERESLAGGVQENGVHENGEEKKGGLTEVHPRGNTVCGEVQAAGCRVITKKQQQQQQQKKPVEEFQQVCAWNQLLSFPQLHSSRLW